MDLQDLVNKARTSELFTLPILEPDLARFFEDHGEHIRALARRAASEGVRHIYWVGSGNSWCNLFSGKYLLDRFSDITSDYLPSYELVWRDPVRLDQDAWVFVASYSGATEDTVAALRHAKARGAHTVALVNSADSLMGQEADEVIAYQSSALYIVPLAAAYLFSLELAAQNVRGEADRIRHEVLALPPLLGKLYVEEEVRAKALAQQFVNEKLFYVLGSGPLYGLAYKFALTVFMENMRLHGSFVETSEFRHGPAEMLEHEKPAMVFLLGTDESRAVGERVLELAQAQNDRIITYDFADYGDLHPLLAPFVLHVPLQWFAVYSALMRGITDLDARVYMGRGIMGQGAGVTWP